MRRVGSIVKSLALAALLANAQSGQSAAQVTAATTSAQSASSFPPELEHLKHSLEQARHRSNRNAEADALYDLAKACFEAHDAKLAESFMRQCIEVEGTLKRPDSEIRALVALANILVSTHRNEDALREFGQALTVANNHRRESQAASIVGNMGALALVSGHYDEAQKLFEEARGTAARNKDASGQGNALVNLSVIARARRNPDEAVKLLTEAIKVLKDGGDDRSLGAAYMELGRTQSDGGEPSEAIASYRQAVELQKGELDNVSAAKSLVAIGQIFRAQDRFNEAESVFKESSELLSGETAPGLTLDVLIGQGGVAAGKGNFAEAERIHKHALAMARKQADRIRERTILSELGYDYFASGSPEQAMNQYVAAFSLLSEQEPNNLKAKGILLTDIAMSCKAVGQLPAAISNYEQAVECFTKAGDSASKAQALNSLAVAYLDNGMLPKFDKHYNQAKELYATLQDRRGAAVLDYNLAQFNLVQGHPADAIPLYEQALANARTAADTTFEGQILRGLGLAYLYLGRSGKSLECYKQAMPLADSSGNIESQWECALGLGKSYKALGQLDEAIKYLRSAAELVEKERGKLSRDSFKTFNLDMRQDCFLELVDVLVKAHQPAEALEYAEKGRARAFLDLLEGRRSRRPNDGLTGDSRAPVPTFDLASLRPAEAGTRGIEVVARATTYVEATTISPINAQAPTLTEIKSLVSKSGSTFVEYFALPDKLLVWVIHPNGQIEMPPPIVISRKALTAKITDTYKAVIAHPRSPEELKLANDTRDLKLRELYSLLFEPVIPFLPKSANADITIVPHGPLFSVPFAALTAPSGKFLVEERTLSYIPAIGVLRATQKLSQESKTGDQQLLAFGNPITKQISFLGTLPYSEKEVKRVAELFGANHSLLKIGGEATKAEFLKDSPGATVIHLATHGLVNEEHPMESALVLAPSGNDDGLLTVRDILQLPALKSHLVVLSACQTARGKITGDGVVGLSRSFIIAGTPSILVSQWNVDDVITEFQMVAFYKSFLAGANKSKSLREAQLKTIALLEKPALGQSPAELKSRANPRYWAAFQLIGELQ
jgi:CHAT domain-containing protein/tetratricopeptide (TPR) repeat protein